MVYATKNRAGLARIFSCLLVGCLTSGAILAQPNPQRNEVAILGGWSYAQSASVASGSGFAAMLQTSTTTTSPSFQVSYARQLLERPVDLYRHLFIALDAEFPLVVAIRDSSATVVTSAGTTRTGGLGTDLFFAPSARLKLFQATLVSVTSSAGFGVASFAPYLATIYDPFGSTSMSPPTSLPSGATRQYSPAFSVGTGIDIRITQPVSIRVDFRDFVTRAGLGGAAGRNHSLFQAGLAFHF